MKDSKDINDESKKKTSSGSKTTVSGNKKEKNSSSSAVKNTRSKKKHDTKEAKLSEVKTDKKDGFKLIDKETKTKKVINKSVDKEKITSSNIDKSVENKKNIEDNINDFVDKESVNYDKEKEIIVERKSGFNILEVIIIIIITLCIGGFIGGGLVYFYADNSVGGKQLPSKLHEFVDTYDEIINNYYKEVDSSKLLDAGIKGMIDYLGDIHSIYMDSETSKDFNLELDGQLVGIGAEIRRNADGATKITNVFENSPASLEDIRVGDFLVKVDGEDISNLIVDEIGDRIRGKAGTTVTVTIKRDGLERDITITRKEVEIPSVVSAAFDRNGKKVGYLGVSIFARNTYQQFNEKLKHLEKNNIDSLIIDVRNNSGGHLDIVRDMASLFLEKNKIVYKLDTKGIVENIYSTSKESRKYPIAVIINGNSASASEILASSLLESYGAQVVGVSSYGKGTVQTSHKLNSGATIKYTHQKWLTPNGNWIDGKGVEPTLVVEMDKEHDTNPSDDTDNQLQAAIDLLSNK